jgi:hypothetical protein
MTQRDIPAPSTSEILEHVAFGPEALAIVGNVFDAAGASLPPHQNGNTARLVLAKCILRLAIAGERNPARLLDRALGRSGRMREPSGEAAERNRLDMMLDEALEETFPASDAIAVIQPVASHDTRKRRVDALPSGLLIGAELT